MGSVWTGVARQVPGSFFSVLGGSGTGQMRLAGGWVFVTVRLLLLYIVIKTGEWDLTVFKNGARGGIFCVSCLSVENLMMDCVCVKIIGMEQKAKSV